MRGGTSKGAVFLKSDLPTNRTERDTLLLAVMGSPDPRQIDGVGGAHPLTSKVAVVSKSDRADADVDYLFLQVSVDAALVSDKQNCGNMLAAVGPFAVERGLIGAAGNQTSVRIRMINTDSIATATFATKNGLPVYDGDMAISGVPGTASPVRLDFEDVAGGSCGSLLPTGNSSDLVGDISVTMIDNGMPTVVMLASDFGVTGYESCAELEANVGLRAKVESIRLQAGPAMNLGDVTEATVPKMTLVAPPQEAGSIATRTFIPHRCHEAIGVLGAVSVATAALLPGAPANSVIVEPTDGIVVIEHPSGVFQVDVASSGIYRTARKHMDGILYPRDY